MMEIEIIRDEDGQYCSEDINMDDDDRGGQSGINAERDSNDNFRKMGDEDLVDSYLSKNDNQQLEIVDNFMSQQTTDVDQLSTKAMMENFMVNAKSNLPSMIDANVENTSLDSTVVGDKNFPFDTNKTEYVLLSRRNDGSSPIMSVAKENPIHLACNPQNDSTSDYHNLPAVDRPTGSNEDGGLEMIFVLGKICAPEGQVFVREIATQTQTPQKAEGAKRKQKDADMVVIREVSEQSTVTLQTVDKPYKCGSCGLKFMDEETRDAHQKCHRRSMRDYYCYFCDFTSPQWTKMHHHLFTHGVEKPYKCDRCSFTCKNKSDLTSHMAVHSTQKQFECRKCYRQYKHRRNVVAHSRSCSGVDETGKPQKVDTMEKYICDVCNRELSSKKNLDKHMEIHSNVKNFVCKTCGHATRLKESLLMHERLHTGEKPFKCHICDYATPDKSSLRRHVRTHTKEKPYKCKFCSYSCIQKHCLDTHVRRKHTGEQFVCGLCQYATYDRYGLNQHFKKHQNPDGTIKQRHLDRLALESQPQPKGAAGFSVVSQAEIGPEANSTDKDLNSKPLSHPMILGIDEALNVDPVNPAAASAENGSDAEQDNESTCSVNDAEETSVELAGMEARLVREIQQPGDEIFVQPTGEIIIKRQDGHILVIQRRVNAQNDGELADDQDYYAAVTLSELPPARDDGTAEIVQSESVEPRNLLNEV